MRISIKSKQRLHSWMYEKIHYKFTANCPVFLKHNFYHHNLLSRANYAVCFISAIFLLSRCGKHFIFYIFI